MSRIVRLLAIAFLSLAFVGTGRAEQGGPAPLFAEDTIIKAVLTAPISQAYSQKNAQTPVYLPGAWAYTDPSSNVTRLDVQIRPRGISRRRNCSYTPLWLNFRKSQVKGTLFSGQDKLKLVSPCKRQSSFQQYLILEYLAYRALQIVTPYSFDTRLVRLSYNDVDKKDKTWTHLTFVIEEHEAVAKRMGTQALKVPAVSLADIDLSAAALIDLFQLMIGNTDFSMHGGPEGSNCCHNVKPIKAKDGNGKVIPIPYDFDSSGLVDAPYAYPASNVRIKDVRQRYFVGRCKSEQYWLDAIKIFQNRQEEIIRLFAENEQLTDRYRKRNVKYLNDFFELLASPKRIEREIFKRCRGKRVESGA